MKDKNGNEIHYYSLFFWLYARTRINNEIMTSNNELKKEFLKDFPNYNINNDNNYINSKIGKCINLIYGFDINRTIIKSKTYYNLELLPKTESKIIIINGNKWRGESEYL